MTTFLYILSRRIVGMVAVHDQSVGYVVCNTKYIQFSKKPSCKCLLGVYQLWVRVKHRYRGISKQHNEF